MKAKIEFEVDSEQQAAAIERAMTDPEVRAFVIVVGALMPHTPRARSRMLAYVQDQIDEEREVRR